MSAIYPPSAEDFMEPLESFLHQSQERGQIARRTFFSISAAGLTSAIAVPFSPLPRVTVVYPGQWQFFRGVLAQLARRFFYGVVEDNLGRWLPDLNSNQQRRVEADSRALEQRGYYDPRSYTTLPIYGENQTSSHCVYYPVDKAGPDEIDGVAPFYDFCTCECKAQLAAPTMLGLERAAGQLRSQGYSGPEAAQCLVPDRQNSASFGVFQTSYSQPDRYVAEDGTNVYVNYERTSQNDGRVRFAAWKDVNNPLVNAYYPIQLA
jgi:hypothetical protein